MQINLEQTDKHSIQAYSSSEIKVNSIHYQQSLIVSQDKIITDWPIYSVQELNQSLMAPILELKSEIIIIGHNQLGIQPPIPILEALSKQKIGLECMAIGAACRTFNVLLSEQRAVAVGIIF